MNCNEVKAKWRTCPVGELAPVSPIDTSLSLDTFIWLTVSGSVHRTMIGCGREVVTHRQLYVGLHYYYIVSFTVC